MSWIGALGKIASGTAAAALAITALPVLGATGAITATGYLVAGAIGTGAAIADKLDEDAKEKKYNSNR